MAVCYIAVVANCLMFFVADGLYLFGSLLFIIANVCFGAALVFYNVFCRKSRPKIRLIKYRAAGLRTVIWAGRFCSL